MNTTNLFSPLEFDKILCHVLIQNTWPAIIMSDFSLRMQIVQGAYFTYDQYRVAKETGKLPFTSPMLVKMEQAYAHNWRNEMMGGKLTKKPK